MKIEIGESLIYSWLRHVKMCRVVQTNWKPSKMWPLNEQDKLNAFMKESQELFQVKYDYHIYKENNDLSQLLQQAEIDVVGVNGDNTETACFAVDIAFHIGGVNYGSRKITVENIVKKLLRSVMCLCGNMAFNSGEIVFASPKINPAVMADLKEPLEDIKIILCKIGFNFNVSVIANQDFLEQILMPVLSVSSDVADTAELFLRSYQLAGMFDQTEKTVKQDVLANFAVSLSAPETKTISSSGKPFKEYILHGKQCTKHEMHHALIKATSVKRTLFYKDGRTITDDWITDSYTANSNLDNNLGSGPLRGWPEKNIVGIKLEID